MPIPKPVIKLKKDGLEFKSSVDRVNYTIRELTRAAMRDVGKFVRYRFRQNFYQHFKKHTGNSISYTQYWIRRNELDLQIGFKGRAFYALYQELGTSKQPKLGLLEKTVMENIADIVRIESQYLSALEDEAKALALIDEDEYEGETDGE